MKSEHFLELAYRVVHRLPNEVRLTLEEYWTRHPAENPFTHEQYPAPQFCLGNGLFENLSKLGKPNYTYITSPSFLLYDAELINLAPVEVVESLVAESLARAFHYLKRIAGGECHDGNQAEAISRLLSDWGFIEDDLYIWLGAKKTVPTDAVNAFYAFRFGRYRVLPPRDADHRAIAELLRQKGAIDAASDLEVSAGKRVRVADLKTEQIVEIPRNELAPGFVRAKVMGTEGHVYVDANQVRLPEAAVYADLSEECKRVIRYCMGLLREVDHSSYGEHEFSFRASRNSKGDLIHYFRKAVVYQHFAAQKVISKAKRLRLWAWICQCSLAEPSTIGEIGQCEPEDRPLFNRVADFYYRLEYMAEFRKHFNPDLLVGLPDREKPADGAGATDHSKGADTFSRND